jgi:hypothetical protein
MPKRRRMIAKRNAASKNGGQVESGPKSRKMGGKPARKQPTGNELMLEAWKKLYESRQNRLI